MAKAKRAWGEGVPNRDEQFELKRQVVLRTAARAYSRNGFHQSTLADIAEALNVSKPTLYYYFRSKDEILFECHQLAIEAITDADHPMPSAAEANGHERLQEFLGRYCEWWSMIFGTCLVMTETTALEPENAGGCRRRRQINAMLQEIWSREMRTEVYLPRPELSAMFIFGAMNWIPRWFMPMAASDRRARRPPVRIRHAGCGAASVGAC